MQIILADILDVPTLNSVGEILADDTLFVSGAATAAGAAKAVKANMQGDPSATAVKGATALIEDRLRAHHMFTAAARPNHFVRTTINRYGVGMSYGAHVDDPMIAGRRVDLAFTVFLSKPDSYDGGELLIQRSDGIEPVKLPAGHAFIYPAGSIHEVRPVTRGERLACIGWIQSTVRRAEHREILFDLEIGLHGVTDPEVRLRLLKSRNALLRLWTE